MESLSETTWDVVLSGTGLSQSLLALALSRSGKKVLHLDKNEYYGGFEAALSLDEANAWANTAENEGSQSSPFRKATVQKDEQLTNKLGFSRAYSLSLSPQIVYTRSNLLPVLVSSKVYRQLEFLAVGSWWLYDPEETKDEAIGQVSNQPSSHGYLRKIPSSREDVVNDTSIDLRSQRSVTRFLQLATDAESHRKVLEDWGNIPFPEFLSSRFKIPTKLQAPFLALTLSPDPPQKTTTSYALPRVHRHLTSIGIFGPGFGAVIPKWGGLAEVAQVGCRAGAVGGGVYVLNKGIKTVEEDNIVGGDQGGSATDPLITLELNGEESILAKRLVGSQYDMPMETVKVPGGSTITARSISIVSSSMTQLFPPPVDGAPPPAAAVVVFPTGSLNVEGIKSVEERSPVYLMIHSSDTGECPVGQSVIYAQTLSSTSSEGYSLLKFALKTLLNSLDETTKPELLWTLQYIQQAPNTNSIPPHNQIITTPDVPLSFVLEDDILRDIRDIWENIMIEDPGSGFMTFEDREGVETEEGDESES